MDKIRILDKFLIRKIAAGEISERPASIVKELIENSLDANASKIDVFVTEGGKSRIIVSDNGVGMSANDVKLSIFRYTTSKLKKIDDLLSLSTFGFRGEALASIASVSKIKILTKDKYSSIPTEVSNYKDNNILINHYGILIGTRIEVKDLFFNIPARLKFLKSSNLEAISIENTVRIAALSKPLVSFRIYRDGKQTFNVKQISSICDINKSIYTYRVSACLGIKSTEYLFFIKRDTGLIRIIGYIVSPLLTRRDTKGIILFINSRPIRDKKLNEAVIISFATLLKIGRFPIVAIDIQLDSKFLDINVHPQKLIVNFSDKDIVIRDFIKLLKSFLAKTPWLKGKSISKYIKQKVKVQQLVTNNINYNTLLANDFKNKNSEIFVKKYNYIDNNYVKDIVFSNKRIKDDDLFKINNEVNLSQLKIIGQIGYIFLLLEADKEILIVDQHAAHERIIFERLKVGQISDAATIKTLLIPIYIILDSIQMSLLYEFGKKINGLGFEIEPFAENCAILRSLPMCFIKHDPEQIIKDLLLELSNVTKVSMLDELQNKIFGKIACYSAIKAGQKLHRQEIISLLKQLEIINYKTHCPHGRNIIKVLSFKQIGYWFDRS